MSLYRSQEPDRIVYQVLKNMSRLRRYEQQREQLERMRSALAQAVMYKCPHINVDRITCGIAKAQRKLEAGTELNMAIAYALELIDSGEH